MFWRSWSVTVYKDAAALSFSESIDKDNALQRRTWMLATPLSASSNMQKETRWCTVHSLTRDKDTNWKTRSTLIHTINDIIVIALYQPHAKKDDFDREHPVVLTFQSVAVSLRTTGFNIQKFYMAFALRWVFCTDIRTKSDFCFIRHWLIGFYNCGGKCLLRGTNWFLI